MVKSSSVSTSSVPNPSTSLSWFFIITTVYFVFKYKNKTNSNSTPEQIINTGKIYGGVYVLLLIVGEFIINLNLTSAMCGNKQYDTALFITLIPWVFIFGLLNVMLTILPGWLVPFSNTFGYAVAKLSGVTTFFNNILKTKLDSLGTKEANEALEHIYSDKSLLINEITQTNIDRFWDNMKSIFKADAYTDANKATLLGFVQLKDVVSEYIWYMLTGALVTSVSYNYAVNKGCTQNVKEIKNRQIAYKKELEENAKNNNVKPKIYSTTE
jgi:hypothetical protein